ncbi:MAG: hypothetical protein IJR59_00025, partial [Firmicutes bacterium]|nr:hypothetical protein [Bacillota bacterium]
KKVGAKRVGIAGVDGYRGVEIHDDDLKTEYRYSFERAAELNGYIKDTLEEIALDREFVTKAKYFNF